MNNKHKSISNLFHFSPMIAFLILGIGLQFAFTRKETTHNKEIKLMGCHFEITAIHENPQKAWDAINAGIEEITRIEELISSWDKHSQTSAINRNAGIRPVKVDQELFDLIARSIKISKITDGAFDISFASIEKLWKFDGSQTTLPAPEAIAKSIAKIDYRNILLDKKERTVFLKEKGMRIGFGGIGKGYAANRAKKLMQEMGIQSGLVNASGDLISWGEPEKGSLWPVAISDPKNKDAAIAWLDIGEMAVVTSGDYEKYITVDGKRYAHIIDPRTGYPTTGIKSVTVVCHNTELADALATSVFVLGKSAGLDLINQLTGIECLIITDEDELITSENLPMELN